MPSEASPLKLSLGTTAVGTAMVCLKRFEYRYIDKLVPKPPEVGHALRRGTMIHACLEAMHRGHTWGQVLADMGNWQTEHGVDFEEATRLSDEVVLIMQGYEHYWAENERYPMTPVAIEQKLAVTLPNGDELSATVDTIVEYGSKGLYLLENKSTSRFPSDDWRVIDPQTALQYLLATLNGYPIEGIIFNYLSTSNPPVPQVLKNTGRGFYARDIKTTTVAFNQGADNLIREFAARYQTSWDGAEASVRDYIEQMRPKFVQDGLFFQRDIVYKPDDMVMEIMRDVKFSMEQIREAHRTGIFPHSINQLVCGFCPYSKVCPVELLKGQRSPGLRQEYYLEANDDLYSEGRPVYDDAE